MIDVAASPQTLTFTDDTSPHASLTDGHKVVIAAQIAHDADLRWFYELLNSSSVPSGELKSDRTAQVLSGLPASKRMIVEAGARCARVHIVDQRPYRASAARLIESASGQPFGYQQLREEARRDPAARNHLRLFGEIIAKEMVFDSHVTRVAIRVGTVAYDPLGVVRDTTAAQVAEVDRWLATLRGTGPEAVIKQAADFVVKAAAALADALDNESAADNRYDDWNTISRVVRQELRQSLMSPHAFDRGNERVLRLLESIRSNLVERLSEIEQTRSVERSPLISLDSAQSAHVQAADVAAGIAKVYYCSEALVGVVRRFDYVTFNGVRISERDAEEYLRNPESIPGAF